ncbi:hypothetical protein SAMN05443549_104110 [Flavobacterium fluvii]|uniref:Uncharacterized protein n=1 Tax=Flavobacterium fluvii TaxID=468056 RepID=A0A1M5JXI4_9FLAO|nr:hypothetical protein SAMN05443549_104110 [Flavobacterium fluvii]
MYREHYFLDKLLDTIFNSKAVALLLKTTRSDGIMVQLNGVGYSILLSNLCIF